MLRVHAIQERLPEFGLDAVIVSSEINQRYSADFAFRDALLLISINGIYVITDQRYKEAAEKKFGGAAHLRIASPGQSLTRVLYDVVEHEHISRIGIEEQRLSSGNLWSIQTLLQKDLLPAQDLFTSLRAVKSPEELGYMRKAQEISDIALAEVLELVQPGMSERQIANELIYRMLRLGCDYGEFHPIVVSGERTSLPHGEPGNRLLREGDFLTMDFGCMVNGYCSDMTRTVAVGYATDEMRAVYEIVLEAQLAGIKAAGPGIRGCDIDHAARQVIEKAGYGGCFLHGFGHGIGLEGHEEPGAGPGSHIPLPAGSLISAEPGIYLPGKFGVRIEDVILVTENGAESIANSPKNLLILNY